MDDLTVSFNSSIVVTPAAVYHCKGAWVTINGESPNIITNFVLGDPLPALQPLPVGAVKAAAVTMSPDDARTLAFKLVEFADSIDGKGPRLD